MRKEHIVNEAKKNSKVKKIINEYDDFGDSYCAQYQECLWNLFENPNSSFPAKVSNLCPILPLTIRKIIYFRSFPWYR